MKWTARKGGLLRREEQQAEEVKAAGVHLFDRTGGEEDVGVLGLQVEQRAESRWSWRQLHMTGGLGSCWTALRALR